MRDDFVYISPQKYDDIDLFLKFLRGSKLGGIDGTYWSMSLGDKISVTGVLYMELLNQIPNWYKENDELTKTGRSSGIQRLILLARYETFLNSIYCLCENISYLVMRAYPQGNLKAHFNQQKKQFLLTDERKTKRNIDPIYAQLLEKTSWYDDVHTIRSEATHYKAGFIFISAKKEPGYLNKTVNARGDVPEQIEIESIEQHSKKIYKELVIFLTEYSKHFLYVFCDGDATVAEPCIRLSDNRAGFRTVSLNDYLRGNPRRCAAIKFNCPYESDCTAIDKPSTKIQT